jgi:hypothetical protein
MSCPAGEAYARELRERQVREAQTLARLTGWPVESIPDGSAAPPEQWWKRIWQ